MRRATRVLAVGLTVLSCAAPALAGRGHLEKRAQKKGWEYPKLTRYTFVQDGREYGRLTLGANTALARFRLKDPFLPVLFVLASEKGPTLHVSPDRFRLLLPDGAVLEPVSYPDLAAKGYRSELVQDWSRRMDLSVTEGYFATGYRRVSSQFYPDPAGRHLTGVTVTKVELEGDNYLEDVLYFPNPGGLAGKELRLVYDDPDTGPGKDVIRRIVVPFVISSPERKAGEGGPQTRPAAPSEGRKRP